MLSRLRQWLLPERPKVDIDFHARMHTARAFGVTQRRESLKAQRVMQAERENRVETAYLHRVNGKDGPDARVD
jgi:hypothetical protein